MKETDQLTYDQAADFLDCSVRHIRRVLQRNGIKPIRLGHRTVRIKAGPLLRLKLKMAMQPQSPYIKVHGKIYRLISQNTVAGRANGHLNGKARR